MNKTDQARRRAAEQELAAIRDMLLAGQEDDDGGQIVPDFEEGMTVYAMVAACLHLLERRRDVIDASSTLEARTRGSERPVDGAIAWHAKRADVHDTHQMLEHDEQANRLRNAMDPNWRIALEEARGK